MTANLSVPMITDDMATLDAAYAYAKARLYIGPCERGSKHPGSILGRDWQRRTSRDPQVITSWFAGTNYGVFIHAGRSDLWIGDVDNPDLLHPELIRAITELEPPYQATRPDQPGRGHYVFQQPPGRDLGNGLGQLANGWGEARGRNGVIVVQPSEHGEGGCYRWLRTGLVPTLPDYVADLLPSALDTEDVATDAQVEAFLAEHRRAGRPELLTIHILAWQKKIAAGESRHSTVMGHITGAMKEAKAGLVDAQLATDTFQSIFEPAVIQQPVGPKLGRARTSAEARSEWQGILAWAVAQGMASDPAETRARVEREVPSDPLAGLRPPQAAANGSAPPPQPSDQEDDFWATRAVLTHMRDFARARRVGPWALLGCVLVRVVASTTHRFVLPPLAGGHVSLNLFTGIVAMTGGGKGTSESASHDAIDLPYTEVVGPGSGEGIGHLFKAWDSKEKVYFQYRDAVIISAAEVSTLNALKGRQSSTLFPELNKAWMGEPLGFAYVAKEKSLHIKRHEYRLCLITGIQPANASTLLDDADSGTPARYLWMPTGDRCAPAVPPDNPGKWRGWSIAKSVNPNADPTTLLPIDVCQTACDAVDAAALDRLHEVSTDPLNSHKLLSRLKTAAALALLESRAGVITEEDWQLAGAVHAVSDQTRERMIHTLRDKTRNAGTARAIEEGRREDIRGAVAEENLIRRACQLILTKLRPDWVSAAKVRGGLSPKMRDAFDAAVERLLEAGQIEMEEIDYHGQPGRRLRLTGQARP